MAGCDLLLTGISGLLGANLALDLAGKYRLAGTCHARRAEFPGVAVRPVDLAEAGAARAVVEELRPQAVIHCAALTDVDACERDPEKALAVNARASGALASACKACGAKLVYISTDAVFPGDRGGYTEDDPTGPVNAYGRSKLEGERLVLEHCPGALVLRTNIFGLDPRPGHGLAEWILARGRAREPFAGFSDVFFAPLSVNVLGRVLEACLAAGLTGVYHAAGTPAVSKERFARELLRAFSLDQGLVRPGSVRDVPFPAPRPLNSALDGFRLAALLPPHIDLGLAAGLAHLARLDSEGRGAALRNAVR